MYKYLAFVYLVCFALYILFSRKPHYFDAEFTNGLIIEKQRYQKQVKYFANGNTYAVDVTGWGASKVSKGEKVRVIYDPTTPEVASLYSFFVYWLQLPELLYSITGFSVLFAAAVAITGNHNTSPEEDTGYTKKRKYND